MKIVKDKIILNTCIQQFWENIAEVSKRKPENELHHGVTRSFQINNSKFSCRNIQDDRGCNKKRSTTSPYIRWI
jgi:hypothetical protein